MSARPAKVAPPKGIAPPRSIQAVHFFVEEPSAEATLRALLPKILEQLSWEVYDLGSKRQLKAKLPKRLAAYASMSHTYPTAVVVLLDRDEEDCAKLKRELDAIAANASLSVESKTAPRFHVANRIVIEELEAWYFGDWEAVCQAYPGVDAAIPKQAAFRAPDEIKGGTWERFEQVLQRAGYFAGGFGKIRAAKEIAPHMEPERNRSPSFQSFLRVVKKIEAMASQSA